MSNNYGEFGEMFPKGMLQVYSSLKQELAEKNKPMDVEEIRRKIRFLSGKKELTKIQMIELRSCREALLFLEGVSA